MQGCGQGHMVRSKPLCPLGPDGSWLRRDQCTGAPTFVRTGQISRQLRGRPGEVWGPNCPAHILGVVVMGPVSAEKHLSVGALARGLVPGFPQPPALTMVPD